VCLLALCLCLFVTQTAGAQTCVANPGKDGPGGALGGVVNTYYPGTATANAGATSITVGASNVDGAATPVAIGDLLLVIQMQDAAINSNNTSAYGANNASGAGATALNNTGHYEYVAATSALGVGGGAVTIRGTGAGNGLLNTYTNAAYSGAQGQRRFQVVRVPQYSSATLGSSLTAAPWDGTSGGILVFDVAGTLALGSASPNVNGLGFRGGGGRQLQGANNGGANTDYRNLATRNFHGQKGEGVAGTPRYVYDPVTATVVDTAVEGYPNGSSARGAPGNAGGGGTDEDPTTASPNGNDKNSGGGGGGNGGDGGTGGNTWSGNQPFGGLGGDIVTGAANLVIMGGGGGAGSRNNSATVASSGGSGGGIVMIRAGGVSGSGTISANGADAYSLTDNDGGGGGGAGGSVVVTVSSGTLAGLSINARGGRGGNAWSSQAAGTPYPGERHGPGGGGGGGFVATTGGAALNVSGGSSGTTTTANDAYGATAGATGQTLTITATQVPGVSSGGQCVPVLTVTKSTSTPTVSNGPTGTTATYTIVVANAASRNAATGLAVSDTLPTSFTYSSTGTVTLAGGATRPTTTNPTLGDAVPNWTSFTIPGGGSVSITFTTKVASGVTGVQQNPATATYLDPGRATTNGTTSASYASASSTNEDVNVLAPPVIDLVKDCTSPANCITQPQLSGTNLTYKITFTNSGGRAAQSFVLTDPDPATTLKISDNTDFKVGSVTTALGGLTSVTVTYSNNGGATFAYAPVSGGGGAPAGYDRNVTHIRWTFTGTLAAAASGNVSFIVRIR
jgi:fimbrial isopeptide formation D2 family protein